MGKGTDLMATNSDLVSAARPGAVATTHMVGSIRMSSSPEHSTIPIHGTQLEQDDLISSMYNSNSPNLNPPKFVDTELNKTTPPTPKRVFSTRLYATHTSMSNEQTLREKEGNLNHSYQSLSPPSKNETPHAQKRNPSMLKKRKQRNQTKPRDQTQPV